MKLGLSVCAAALMMLGAGSGAQAQAPKEFKIGVVMSLSGGFVAAAKDTMDGVEGWEKARGGLPGKKIVYEKLDDETNFLSCPHFATLLPWPEWRNRQTQWIQNPSPARACGFESRLGHLSRAT